MATSMCRAWISRSIKVFSRGISFSARRQLLSEAYSCREVWQKRLNSPILQNVSLSEFSIQLREQFEKKNEASVIDMDIFANKLQDMDRTELDFMESLIHRFRRSKNGTPPRDSISHAIIRAYMDLGETDRLLVMMRDKMNYGIFPDKFAASILLDHFIKGDNYADAAKVAYELMLQEDFSHPISFLLSLQATTRHLVVTSLAQLTPDTPPEDTSEEDWVKVNVIRFPYYDDHFDIKDERFLLGKTLYMLGQQITDNELLSNSLKVIGLGLYQKFGKGLLLLDELAGTGSKGAILEEALNRFDECIENAETRDPEAPAKDFGLRTVEDEIYKLRMTPDGKEELTTEFEEIAHKLRWNNQTVEDDLKTMVESRVTSELSQHESGDIQSQESKMAEWERERSELVQKQLKSYMEEERKKQIQDQLKELQEKEEMLRYFELRDKIILAKNAAPKIKPPPEEDDEDTLRAKRIKRRKYRHHV